MYSDKANYSDQATMGAKRDWQTAAPAASSGINEALNQLGSKVTEAEMFLTGLADRLKPVLSNDAINHGATGQSSEPRHEPQCDIEAMVMATCDRVHQIADALRRLQLAARV